MVGAVSRGLDVLEVFLQEPGPLTVAQIAQRVQVPRSTLHEIVHTLRVRGYLQTRTALLDELRRTRERGYAVDDCESNMAVRCIAAPARLSRRLGASPSGA